MFSSIQFIIGGTQKGGTTFLASQLSEHPGLLIANQKEVHFFDEDDLFRNNKINYRVYHKHFDFGKRPSQKIRGEATPIYMYWYQAPERIWQYNPLMKWILILRNPIERAYSHWNMERSKGHETWPFFEAVLRERERCRTALPKQHRYFSYIDRGFYSEQIRRIWHFFPSQQTLLLKSEWLKERPGEVLQQVCSFLGVANVPLNTQAGPNNQGHYCSEMSAAERAYLREVFMMEVLSLEKLVGWNCKDWLL